MDIYARLVKMNLEEQRAIEAEREELKLEMERHQDELATLKAKSEEKVGAATDCNRSRPTATESSRNSSQKNARGKQSPAKSSLVLKLERELCKKPRYASLVKG